MIARRLIGSALFAVASFGLPQATYGDTETFKLQYVKPSQMLRALQVKENNSIIVKGIDQLTARDAKQTLIVSGNPASLKDLRDIVRLLDIKPRILQLKIALVRFHFRSASPADWDVETVAESVVSTANNFRTDIRIDTIEESDTLWVQPRINGDKTITVFGELNLRDRAGSPPRKISIEQRKISAGRKTTVVGTTDSTKADIQRAVTSGQLPASGEEHTAYYLQITPTLLEQPNNE